MSDLPLPPSVGNVAPPAWHNFQIPAFAGQGDTHIDTGEPYSAVRIIRLFTMPVAALPKLEGPAIIPSTYCGHDARKHQAQRDHGQFVMLTADIDTGDHPREIIETTLKSFAGDVAWLAYSSASSRPGHRKWRALVPLAVPVGFETWHAAQMIFHDHIAAAGVEPDRSLARPGQIVFAANVPHTHIAKDGTETALRGDDGQPLYFDRSHSDMNAPGLNLHQAWLALDIMARVENMQAEEARRRDAAAEAKRKREERDGAGSTPIDRFNDANDLSDLLAKYGYADAPHSADDWQSPLQRSGSYATRVMTEDDGRQYWISMSGSDREAGLGRPCASGCCGDAFDLFAHFEHGGDSDAALTALREAEMANDFEGVVLPELLPSPGLNEARSSRFALNPFWAGDSLPPAKPWLLYKVLPRVAVAMLVGPSQAGKTFVALELARALAEGQPFFGTAPREACGALLLAGEGMTGLRPRASLLGKLPIAIADLPVMGSAAELAQLTEAVARDVATQMRAVRGARLGVVIIDTLSASGLLTAENDNGEAAKAVNAAKLMAHALGCLVLVVHHPGKNGTDSRGAYALHANVDTEIKIDYEEGKALRIVRLTKSKESAAPKVLGCFTLEEETVGVDAYGDPVTTCRIVTGAYEPGMEVKASLVSTITLEQVASCQEAIAGGDYRAAVQCGAQWAGYAVAKALGLSADDRVERSSVQAVLDRLLVEGWLRTVPERNPDTRKTREFVRVGKPAVDEPAV